MSSAHKKARGDEVTQDAPAAPPAEITTLRSRKIITLSQFAPDRDWIMKNVAAKEKGHSVTVGRIFGIVTGTREKEGFAADGVTPITTVDLVGIFESKDTLSGESSEAALARLPAIYADTVHKRFADNSSLKALSIDVDVAIEATGSTPPYAWTISDYIVSERGDVMGAMRDAHQSRTKEE